MKIALAVHCFFPDHYFGTEFYTLTVAKELAALGHDVTVVSARFVGEPQQKSLIEEYTFDGLRVISIDKNAIPHRSVRETYDQPQLLDVHLRILRELSPDIVHVCHLINHTAALLNATRILNIPTVATLTDFFGFCFTNQLEGVDGSLCAGPSRTRANCVACYLKAADTAKTPHGALSRTLFANLLVRAPGLGRTFGFDPRDLAARPGVMAEAFRHVRQAIAPSTFLKRAYEANSFPVPLSLSHFGIDIARAPKPPRPPGAPIRLGYVGQIAPHKGVHILMEALRVANRPNLAASIWGPHDQAPAYFNAVVDAGKAAGATYRGLFPSEQTAGILAGLDALVIPSTWYENSPMILLQALATHTPVIVSGVDGMTEFVTHGDNGFHFTRGDSAALAAVLQRIADDKDLLPAMSRRTEYTRTPRDMVADLTATYSGVLR